VDRAGRGDGRERLYVRPAGFAHDRLRPGGALFFHSLLYHGTPPNDSPSSRRALQFHYAGLSCVQRSLREHADDFYDGDMYGGCRTPKTVAVADLAETR
jgi:hypothetical protein